MEVSQHIMRINNIIGELTEELHTMQDEGHINHNPPAFVSLNDMEMNAIEFRKAILQDEEIKGRP